MFAGVFSEQCRKQCECYGYVNDNRRRPPGCGADRRRPAPGGIPPAPARCPAGAGLLPGAGSDGNGSGAGSGAVRAAGGDGNGYAAGGGIPVGQAHSAQINRLQRRRPPAARNAAASAASVIQLRRRSALASGPAGPYAFSISRRYSVCRSRHSGSSSVTTAQRKR